MNLKLKKISALVLVFILLASVFAGCKKTDDTTTGTTSTTATTAPPVPPVDLGDYAIIRPESTSDEIVELSSELYAALVVVTGKSHTFESDWLAKDKTADSDKKEILIGATNRGESKEVINSLEAGEYAIRIVGNKIVIAGSYESITPKAVSHFIDIYLKDASSSQLAGDLSFTDKLDVSFVVSGGESTYKIIRSEDATSQIINLMYNVQDSIKDNTGAQLSIGTDKIRTGDVISDTEIHIGITDREECEAVMGIAEPNTYGVYFIEDKIIIFGWDEDTLSKAVEYFVDLVKYSVSKDADGNAMLCIPKLNEEMVYAGANYYIDIPYFVGDTKYKGVVNCHNNTLQLYFAGVSEAEYNAYKAELVADGATVHQTNDSTSIFATTYKKDSAQVHVYYTVNTKEMRVITQKDAAFPINAYEYESITSPAVTALTSDGTNVGSMSYLIRLADSTFVIIDGGQTNADATILYNEMKKQNTRSDGKLIVTAWFLTHAHVDHFGALDSFIQNYQTEVTVKYFIGNEVPDILHRNSDTTRGWLYSKMKDKFGGCQIIKAHTGQRFEFPGATFNILYTHEDIYPVATFDKFNSTSMVFDTIIANKRFMWLADTEKEGADKLKVMYYYDLKCDYMQVAHHGVNGASIDVYAFCDPDVVFWPANASLITQCSNIAQNKWIFTNVDTIIYRYNGNYTVLFEAPDDFGELDGNRDSGSGYSKMY